jgi:predicted O-methyltransferase YrrM
VELFKIAGYARYLIRSGHRKGHGIHGPFLFDVISRILQNKIDPAIVFRIEAIRKKMEKDTRLINFCDYGSGSKKMKSDKRRVSDIVKNSSVPEKYCFLLSRLSSVFGKPLIIEFGTSLGISTMYLALSCPDATVYTMEGCRATSEIACSNFGEARISNVKQMNGRFEDLLPEIIRLGICPGLIFIDGNHRKDPTVSYFGQVAEIAGNDTIVIIDDINHSSEMADAWAIIRNDGRVSASIDIFKMGIVFFRKGITPGRYMVRY